MKAQTINHLEASAPPNSIYGCVDYFEQKNTTIIALAVVRRFYGNRPSNSNNNKGERAK